MAVVGGRIVSAWNLTLAKDEAHAALLKSFKQFHLPPVEDPSLRTLQMRPERRQLSNLGLPGEAK